MPKNVKPKSEYVSIHAPVRERRCSSSAAKDSRRFNSRSREGATSIMAHYLLVSSVSIHAPVRERLFLRAVISAGLVSIHAPVRERLDIVIR